MKSLRLTALMGLFFAVPPLAAALDPLADAGKFLEAGNYTAAVERLRQVAPFQREQIQGRFLYATALAGAGERDKAIEMFEELIADHPSRPEPYNNLAALYAAQGRLDKAKETLEKAIRTDESYSAVYDNLSTVYVEMARSSYVKALRLNETPHTPNLHLLYAMNQAGPSPAAPMAVAAAPASAAPEGPAVRPAPPPAARPQPAVADQPKGSAAAEGAGTPAPAEAVEKTLRTWAREWSARDVEGYLGHYAPDFAPPGLSRSRWETERRQRLAQAGSIEVTLEEVEVRMTGANEAVVRFVQRYASPRYSDRTRKEMTLIHSGGRWLIRGEKSLGLPR